MSICKISIIIPAYNAAKYIASCIDSILKQTHKEYEILVINDGSFDETETIVNRYCEKYGFIRQIVQKNKGVAAARNTGIAEAKGKWVMFVDADDLMHSQACEMADKFSDPCIDMLLFHEIRIRTREITEERLNDKLYTVEYRHIDRIKLLKNTLGFASRDDLLEVSSLGSVWGKAYRLSFLKEYGILFPEGVKNGEDMLFNMRCFNVIEKVLYVKAPVYYYYDNNDSLSNRYKPDIDEITDKFYAVLNPIVKTNSGLEKQYYMSLINNYFIEMYYYLFHPDNLLAGRERFGEFRKRTGSKFYQSAFSKAGCLTVSKVLGLEKGLVVMLLKLRLYGIVSIMYGVRRKIRCLIQ